MRVEKRSRGQALAANVSCGTEAWCYSIKLLSPAVEVISLASQQQATWHHDIWLGCNRFYLRFWTDSHQPGISKGHLGIMRLCTGPRKYVKYESHLREEECWWLKKALWADMSKMCMPAILPQITLGQFSEHALISREQTKEFNNLNKEIKFF